MPNFSRGVGMQRFLSILYLGTAVACASSETELVGDSAIDGASSGAGGATSASGSGGLTASSSSASGTTGSTTSAGGGGDGSGGGCVSECGAIGVTQCDGPKIRICEDVDNDACL